MNIIDPHSHFKVPYTTAEKELTETKKRYKENTGKDDFERAIFEIPARYIAKNPYRYKLFGVYWWTLKQILIEKNLLPAHIHIIESPAIADEYYVRDEYDDIDPIATVLCADKFKTYCLKNFILGTTSFHRLDGVVIDVFDSEMEEYASQFGADPSMKKALVR